MSQTPPSVSARKRLHPLLQGLAGLVFAGILIGMFGDFDDHDAAGTATTTPAPTSKSAATPTAAVATTAASGSVAKYTIKETSFGCLTPDAFKDASSYWLNEEKGLLAQMFDSGQCELLKKGEAVILVDVKFMEYAVVRRPGDATKLITFQSVF